MAGADVSPGANIGIATLPNLRDLGGWTTPTGRVRRGLLYRSMELGKVSDGDMPAVAALRLRTVYDLRTEAERSAEPDRLPEGAAMVVLDVLADSPGAGPAQLLAAEVAIATRHSLLERAAERGHVIGASHWDVVVELSRGPDGRTSWTSAPAHQRRERVVKSEATALGQRSRMFRRRPGGRVHPG